MKFSCEQCQTKYSIADEKIRGKVLKIRCKACGNIILLREMRPQPAAAPAPTPQGKRPRPAPTGARPQRPATRPAPDGARAKRRPGARESEPAQAGPRSAPASASKPRRRSKSASSAASKIAKPRGAVASPAPGKPRAATAAKPRSARPSAAPRQAKAVVWYLALQGKQSPPLSQQEVSARIRALEVKQRTYAWNPAMKNWTRLGELEVFKADFEWLRARSGGAQVVDFKKKVAERERAKARAGRQAALDALDQIADLVRDRPDEESQPAARPARRPSAKPAPAARSKTPSAAPIAERLTPAAQRSAEDFFFDPSSVESFISSSPMIEKEAVEDSGLPVNADPLAGFDPFDLAPSVSTDQPRRESTRIFMAAAGLRNEALRKKIVAGILIALAVAAVLAVLLDAVGAIRIPVLHYYVESVKQVAEPETEEGEATDAEREEEALPLTEGEKAAIRTALLEGNQAKVEEVKLQARKRARKQRAGRKHPATADLGDHVDTKPAEDVNTGRRGGGETAAVDLSPEERDALVALGKSDKKGVELHVRPGLKEIRMPIRHRGGLSSKQIAAVIGENQEGVKRCASQETKYGVELPPALTVTIRIQPSGLVAGAQLGERKFAASQLGRCLTKTVKKWRFPEFSGQEMEVEIPFKFTAVH